MASKVKLDPERLQELIAQAQSIQRECDTNLNYINRVRSELDWDVPEKVSVDETLADLQRRIVRQKEKMDAIIAATDLAIIEAGNAENSLKNRILNLILRFFSIIASTPIIGQIIAISWLPVIVSVLHELFGIDALSGITSVGALRDWINSLIGNDDTDAETILPQPDEGNHQETLPPSGGEAPGDSITMDADTEVYERAKRMEKRYNAAEGSPDYVDVRVSKTNGDGSINCVWLARQKICDILGDNTLFSDGSKIGERMDGWKKYEATGINGYSVDYMEPGEIPLRNVVDDIKQSQPSTVVFYCKTPSPGHTFTVDRIENGQMYFTDQRKDQSGFNIGNGTTHVSDIWAAGSGEPVSISLDDFAKSEFGNNLLYSYVILKR